MWVLLGGVLLSALPLGCSRRRSAEGAAASARPSAAPVSEVTSGAAPAAEPLPRSELEPEAAAWFPERSERYERDRHSDLSSFGGPSDPPIDSGCRRLGLDCALLTRFGLRRVVRLPYVEVAGPGRVLVTVLRFGSAEHSFGWFTARLAEARDVGRPRYTEFSAGGFAVQAETSALVWRAESVAELVYADERRAPHAQELAARDALPPLARALGERLPGNQHWPDAARLLPEAERVPLSVVYEPFDLFGIEDVGPGARAAYARGTERSEISILVRVDEDAADDVLETFRKLPGARWDKLAPYRATRFALVDEKSSQTTEWIFGQRGRLLAGVGEPFDPTVVPRKRPLLTDPKLRRLKLLLDALRAPPRESQRAPW